MIIIVVAENSTVLVSAVFGIILVWLIFRLLGDILIGRLKKELIKKPDGVYRRFYEIQSGLY